MIEEFGETRFRPEDGSSTNLWNVTVPQHHTASQPRRRRLE